MNIGTQIPAQPTSILFPEMTLAYVRPVNTDKGKAFAVCSSSGETLALFATQDAAFFAAKQHDLEPVLVH